MKKSKDKMILLFVNLVLILIMAIEFFTLNLKPEIYDLLFRKALDLQFLIVLLFSVLCGILLYGLFQPYNIFLGTFFIFLGGRFLLDLFNLRDVMLMDRFINIYLGKEEQIELFEIMIFSILLINTGYLISSIFINSNQKIERTILKKEIFFRKIFVVLFQIFFFLDVYKKIILLNFALRNNYLEIYKTAISYPFYLKGSGTFLVCFYMLILLSRPTKRQFIFLS